MIGLHRVRPQIDGKFRFDPQQIAPLQGPVVSKVVALQKTVDQQAAFVTVVVCQETLNLFGSR